MEPKNLRDLFTRRDPAAPTPPQTVSPVAQKIQQATAQWHSQFSSDPAPYALHNIQITDREGLLDLLVMVYRPQDRTPGFSVFVVSPIANASTITFLQQRVMRELRKTDIAPMLSFPNVTVNGAMPPLVNTLADEDFTDAIAENVVRHLVSWAFETDTLNITQMGQLFKTLRDEQLSLSMMYDHQPTPVWDCLGQPVRTDISLTLTAATQKGTLHENHTTPIALLTVSGYLDYRPVSTQTDGFLPTKKQYVPEFVVTHIGQPDAGIKLADHHAVCLAIAMMSRYMRSSLWRSYVQAMFNTPKSVRYQMHGEDIALQDLFAPGYAVSVDVPTNPTLEYDLSSILETAQSPVGFEAMLPAFVADVCGDTGIAMGVPPVAFAQAMPKELHVGRCVMDDDRIADTREIDSLTLRFKGRPHAAENFEASLLTDDPKDVEYRSSLVKNIQNVQAWHNVVARMVINPDVQAIITGVLNAHGLAIELDNPMPPRQTFNRQYIVSP